MKELIKKYKPDILWTIGDWVSSEEYWGSKEFVAWVYNESPVRDYIVISDHWGKDVQYPPEKQDFNTCEKRGNFLNSKFTGHCTQFTAYISSLAIHLAIYSSLLTVHRSQFIAHS